MNMLLIIIGMNPDLHESRFTEHILKTDSDKNYNLTLSLHTSHIEPCLSVMTIFTSSALISSRINNIIKPSCHGNDDRTLTAMIGINT